MKPTSLTNQQVHQLAIPRTAAERKVIIRRIKQFKNFQSDLARRIRKAPSTVWSVLHGRVPSARIMGAIVKMLEEKEREQREQKGAAA